MNQSSIRVTDVRILQIDPTAIDCASLLLFFRKNIIIMLSKTSLSQTLVLLPHRKHKIQLEMNKLTLYPICSSISECDRSFWWRIVLSTCVLILDRASYPAQHNIFPFEADWVRWVVVVFLDWWGSISGMFLSCRAQICQTLISILVIQNPGTSTGCHSLRN